MRMLIAFIFGLLALPIVLVLAGLGGWLPSNATANPPGWERSIGGQVLDASLESRSKGLSNTIPGTDSVALAAGGKIYSNNCAGCHGSAKGPSAWGAKGFYPRAPQFFQERPDLTAPEAYAAIHDGIRYSGMGAWRDLMKEDDMWKVANFVASIHSKGGNTEGGEAK
jgi:mono/diheme cytochrome c family protein